MHPDSSLIAALTGCAPEQAQAALDALVAKGWASPSDVIDLAADSEAVEQATPSSEDGPAKGLLRAHTDGACSGNPGPGGWTVVFSRGDKIVEEFSGGLAAATTNNRMELTAVLEAVRRAPKGSHLEVHTDSRNVIGWLAKGWKRNDAILAALCREIDEQIAKRGTAGAVSFHHVCGHRGHQLNERADQLATAAIEKVRHEAA